MSQLNFRMFSNGVEAAFSFLPCDLAYSRYNRENDNGRLYANLNMLSGQTPTSIFVPNLNLAVDPHPIILAKRASVRQRCDTAQRVGRRCSVVSAKYDRGELSGQCGGHRIFLLSSVVWYKPRDTAVSRTMHSQRIIHRRHAGIRTKSRFPMFS